MTRWPIAAGALLALVLCSVHVTAGEAPEALSPEDFAELFPGMDPADVRDSPLPGIYEVAIGASVVYVSKDGRHLLRGQLIDLDTDTNLTEDRERAMRLALIESDAAADAVVFAPDSPSHWVTVFTDIDCGYCQRMHREIDRLNELGIGVRYLFYPRGGPGSSSWDKADNVWCAGDRQDAMTRAKAGESVDAEACGSTPVADHYALGQDVGIRGTPAVVSDRGVILGGYLPPEALLARLRGGR